MLIVQFAEGDDGLSYDEMIAFEDALVQAFAQNGAAEVDGHDVGSGTMNVFIEPKGSWKACIEVVMAHLKLRKLKGMAVVAKRLKSERYKVVWPENYDGEFALL